MATRSPQSTRTDAVQVDPKHRCRDFPGRGIPALIVAFLGMVGGFLFNPGPSRAQSSMPVNATTFHYDPQRTGWNSLETVLTPSNVSGPQFGPLWNSEPLDSVTIGSTTFPPHLYATPLYVDSVLITSGAYAGQQFQVVFAATTNNYVYAINAFDVAGWPGIPAGTILWRTSLGAPTNFGLDGGVALGVLATPVIDLNTTPPRLYVAADAVTDTPRAPDGKLNLLRFEALRDSEGADVLESHVVTYAPSATVLHLIRKEPRSTVGALRSFLGVGGVIYSPHTGTISGSATSKASVLADFFGLDAVAFPDLPGSTQEVVEAAGIVRGANQVLLGADTTESNFKKSPRTRT